MHALLRPPRPRRLIPPALVVAALATSALVALPVQAVARDDRAAGASSVTDRTPAPPIRWGPCDPDDFLTFSDGTSLVPATYQCADYAVPLEYGRPRGPKITLSLIRRPADDQANKQGTLFVNPGGPGGSGVDLAAYGGDDLFGEEVERRFDIVGFDPRGVGGSTELRCHEDNAALRADAAENEFQGFLPETGQEWLAVRRDVLDVAQDCDDTAGPIIDHMSTANVARDLDVLRRAVGDDHLTFAGYSYGTVICANYANLYPDRVGALVCDGNLDPVEWTTGEPANQWRHVPMSARIRSEVGSNATLEEYFRLCDEVGPQRCPLAPGAADRFAGLHESLSDSPVDLVYPSVGITEPLAFDENLLLDLTYQFLAASPGTWSVLGSIHAELERLAAGGAPDPDPDPGTDPGDPIQDPVNEPYLGGDSFDGVTCSDSRMPSTIGAWRRAVRNSEGYYGPSWAFGDVRCAKWPGADRDRYLGPFTARTANPVLIVNATFDTATPYEDAVAHRKLLPNSRLLTVDGWAHVAAGLSACADAIVDDYLLTRSLPEGQLRCAQDTDPFFVPDQPSTPDQTASTRTTAEPTGAPDGVTEQVVEEAADAALLDLAATGDPASAVNAAGEVTIAAIAASGDTDAADRLEARQVLLSEALAGRAELQGVVTGR